MLMAKNKFRVGLRVLPVDNDRASIQVWGRMLQACGYEVTKCLRAEMLYLCFVPTEAADLIFL